MLKEGGGRSSVARSVTRLRDALVVSEIALACVLLVFGGLFLRSFRALLDVDLGYQSSGAMAWQLNPSASYESPAEEADFYELVFQSVAAVPGVEHVGLIDALPLGRNRSWSFRVVGYEYEDDQDAESLFPHIIDQRYLEAMGIPIVSGRGFTQEDRTDTERVALINQSGAREVFGSDDPVGHYIQTGNGESRIVGVVGDVRHHALEAGSGTQIYFPIRQMWDYNTLDMVVRSRLAPDVLSGSVKAALGQVDPQMPSNVFWTLDATVDRATSSRRFVLTLLASFAVVALLLAALGIYGVLSYSVAEQRTEIGIRMALGATAAQVRRRVVARTLILAAAGIGIGVVGAIAGSGMIASLLFGVGSTDPTTFFGMIAVLFLVAALSGFIPALRAARTDSTTVLRG